MKNIYISFVITLLCFFSNAQNYYYYQGQRIELQENHLVRYVKLKHTITPFEAKKYMTFSATIVMLRKSTLRILTNITSNRINM